MVDDRQSQIQAEVEDDGVAERLAREQQLTDDQRAVGYTPQEVSISPDR